MRRAIADTHAVIWYLFGDRRLSPTARAFVEAAAAQGDQIGISAITLAELVYPIEKGRIPAETFTRLMTALDAPDAVLVEIPFDRRIAATLRRVDRLQVPDLPDRLIAATALSLGLPLISRDSKIRASAITTIW